MIGSLGPNGSRQVRHDARHPGPGPADRRKVLVAGRRYAAHPAPLREVGALFDARPRPHGGCPSPGACGDQGIGRVGGFSLGMT